MAWSATQTPRSVALMRIPYSAAPLTPAETISDRRHCRASELRGLSCAFLLFQSPDHSLLRRQHRDYCACFTNEEMGPERGGYLSKITQLVSDRLEPGQSLWATCRQGPLPRWLRARMTSPSQGILFSFASRRQRDPPSWRIRCFAAMIGGDSPLVLGTVCVEERASTSVTHKQPLPKTSALPSVE